MRTVVGLLLIIGAIALGYYGYKKYQDSKEAGVQIGNIEISASDNHDRTNAWLMMGGGAVCLIAGAVLMSKKSK